MDKYVEMRFPLKFIICLVELSKHVFFNKNPAYGKNLNKLPLILTK